MQLNQIKREHKQKKGKLVGRGGRRGKTSGRGHKGQRARAGHRIRPQIRDIMKRLPKLRGFKFPKIGEKPEIVKLALLEKHFEAGAKITPAILLQKKLIRRYGGKLPQVKILADGKLTKKLEIENCLVSASAKKIIEEAGGKII